jgi:two-component system phosphate regulon sensor histidine kinase PhoR
MEDAPGRGEIDHLRKAVLTTGRALEKEIGNLKRIESYRRDFLGNVSHELKTPIFAIHGFAETLLDGALDSPEVRVEFVEKILRNSERLDNLANDLSEIAKIETGELKMSPAFFDLEELLVDVVESLESRALQKNISITYRTDPRLKPMFADDGRVRQVLLNLVDNGIKYTNPGGTVLISARLVGEAIKTTVSDSGIGIAAEHIDRLTERFYRVDTSRSRSQGGTGLGLAIVKHILSAHGSRLLVQSKPGYGTTFSFSLPTTDSRSDYNPSSGDLRESTSRQESLRS